MSSITAGTSAGTALVHTADTSGSLLLKTGASAVTGLTIDASQNVTLANPLPVASGGTNSTATPTAGGIVYGTGTAQAVTAAGTSGQVLTSAGSGAPVWANASSPIATDLTKYDSVLSIASTIGSSVRSLSVAVNATTEILIFWGASSAYAVLWDNTAKTFGATVLLRTASFAGAADIAAITVSSSSVLVCSLPANSTALETVVLSVSGSTITVNTPIATTLAANSNLINGVPVNNGYGRLIQVGTSYVLSYFATSACYRAITVSGTTPTVGSELTFTSGIAASVVNLVYSSSIFVHVSTSSPTGYAVPVSVSGTTLTQGTQATFTISANLLVAGLLTNNRIAIAYLNTTAQGGIVSISGTTATVSSVNLTITGNLFMQVQGTQALIFSSSGTPANNKINVLTDSSGTAVAGTALTVGGGSAQYYTIGGNATQMFLGQNVAAMGIEVYSISGNNPNLDYIVPNTTTTTTNGGANNSFNPYSSTYANLQNSDNLYTSTYKIVAISGFAGGNRQALITAFNGTTLFAFYEQNVPMELAAANFYAKSALNTYSAFVLYNNSTYNPLKVTIRRVELA